MIALDTKQIKQTGWDKLSGKWTPACVAFLLYILVTLIISAPTFLFEKDSAGEAAWTWISNVLTWILDIGLAAYFLDLVLEKPLFYKRLFYGYSRGFLFAINVFVTQLLMGIFIFLWCLLLIIPGIMRAYSYSLILFILVDHPEYSPLEAIRKSKEMMYGHRMELFVLNLRFIPWALLGIITLGIGFIWVVPYVMSAFSEFYQQIKEQNEVKVIEAEEIEAQEISA